MKHPIVGLLLLLAACDGGGKPTNGPDAAPVMVTVGGSARERTGQTSAPVSDVAIAVYDRKNDQMALATTTTDGAGKFTLTYSAPPATEIVLGATKTGFVGSYFYPAGSVGSGAPMFPIDMVSTANHGALYAGLTLDPAKGTVELIVSASNSTIAGATIATQPAAAAYRYNDPSGQPSASATATATDGIAFALNVPSGMVTIDATKSGIVLKMPRFPVRAGALNQAEVTP